MCKLLRLACMQCTSVRLGHSNLGSARDLIFLPFCSLAAQKRNAFPFCKTLTVSPLTPLPPRGPQEGAHLLSSLHSSYKLVRLLRADIWPQSTLTPHTHSLGLSAARSISTTSNSPLLHSLHSLGIIWSTTPHSFDIRSFLHSFYSPC